MWTDERIAANIAEMLGTGDASARHRIPGTRYFERLQIEDVPRSRRAGVGIPHQVEPPEKLTRAIEIPFKVVGWIVGRSAG